MGTVRGSVLPLKQKNGRPKRQKSRLKLLHQYYNYTGFYSFIIKTLRNAVLPVAGLLLLVFIVDRFIVDLNLVLENATDTLSAFLVFTVFFISESLLGLLPPEIFIAWSAKADAPWVHLTGLALLAYMGGSVSYYIGRMILTIPAVTRYVKLTWAKHIRNLRRWGGFMIVSSAFLPLPFSIASMVAGLIEYDYKRYLFWALSRIVRFYLYAWLVYRII